ncbi:acetate--CoA ligase family protein [Mesorhizobium sp. J428]|uniref:acetate--CoA ligase family protein n=1 Tax=Mesorhizobium sp. J428 TaxID=2898440 RepID=UPI002151111F|nr:acetate--CoA ligase family protein [Mesorhizobium sp. J428]MCR5859923.1 acetate--CoA ligase family protein [Mesorhizobium sp. J428]
MSQAGFVVFEDPNRAVAAVGALLHFARHFDRPAWAAVDRTPTPRAELEAAASDPAAGAALRARIGVPDVPARLAVSVDEAAAAAAGFAYPVVLKIASPDIQHKTEVGGVKLGLADEAALRQAWSEMMTSVEKCAPAARIAGATVSPMFSGGVETIIGTQNDPDLGPVVMFGLGGTMAEALKDVVFAPAPVDEKTALGMIGAIRASAVLDGWRGAAPSDKTALAHAIVALSRFAAANRDSVASVEVNPFVALPKGGVALDMLLQLREGN